MINWLSMRSGKKIFLFWIECFYETVSRKIWIQIYLRFDTTRTDQKNNQSYYELTLNCKQN
jgi:hypothetical protein